MNQKFLIALFGAAALTLVGCDSDSDNTGSGGESETGGADDDDSDDDDAGETAETSPDPTASTDPTDPTDSTNPTDPTDATDTDPTDPTDPDTSDSDETSFIVEPDGGGVAVECDVWTDDCPEGEKCMPWANDGGNSWNATRCSPLDDAPGQIGDACSVEGSGVSGIDSCDTRSMCYYVDPDTSEGVCVGFCEGTPQAPTCGADFICTIVNDGVLTLCRPECDPLLQDCDGTAACLPATGAEGFTCIIDASGEGGAYQDPCEFINACDPGLFCANAELVPGCVGTGCCSDFCDLSEANCNDAAQECLPWFEEGATPPGLEDVGACGLPV